MKQLLLILVLITTFFTLKAQNSTSHAFTYGEFKLGYGTTQFGKGLETAFEAGNFSTSSGFLASIAVYRKFSKIHNFNFGLKFKALGAGPATNDVGDEMFFNYWGTAVSAKYFPFNREADKGFFIQGDFYFTTQFTQKYRNTDALTFDHQFAIGTGFGGLIAYDLRLKNSLKGLTIGIEYDAANRQGEVTGIGDVQFANSNVGVMVGIQF